MGENKRPEINLLISQYYDPSRETSYSGKAKLIRSTRGKISVQDLNAWLHAQDAYTKHVPVRRKFPRRSYNVSNMDDVWEADLVDLRSLSRYNDGYAYILTVIDVLSKFAWVEPIKQKTASEVSRAFLRILEKSPRRPVYLQTDKGKEFIGTSMQNTLKNENISFRVARSPDVKAAIVERFNRTLKERMWRYFTHQNTKRFIDVLQKIVFAYNHALHSSIKMIPANVTLENAAIARANLIRRVKKQKLKRSPKYAVGDTVRISNAKGAFAKGYEGSWSTELFIVDRILDRRLPIVYVLRDLTGEEIDGFFYEQELIKVEKNLTTEEFQIDRIIRSKGKGSRKLLFVSWKGYPEKFNSWIPASSLKNIF